ncbi:hypothetical protein VPNG_09478 [Cytospora leucostoma]|uniref:EXPERA domain-containing protein n=1 Tax=Cytospora leucostoma TaxID=1230097 RepID=A0A423VVD9_9PEZI|nr:hypothetical protein VPNG_09478 [Cytospora leucostoma]
MGQTNSVQAHSYYPRDAYIPDYVANVSSVPQLMASFGGLLGITISTALWVATRFNPRLGLTDKLVFGVDSNFQGYFVYNHTGLAGSQDLFAQLWKEYALSDSRYLTSDPFMLCVETITVTILGPLCFAAAVSIVRGGSLRHPLQVIVSVAHLYGVALYYSTSFFSEKYRGTVYGRPEFLYYWIYYIGFNAPWVIAPAALLTSSVRFIQRGAVAIDKAAATLDRKRVTSRTDRLR